MPEKSGQRTLGYSKMQANGQRGRRPGRAWPLLVAAVWAVALSAAAQAVSGGDTVRYPIGDDARWAAAPAFDDSGWAAANQGLVPSAAGQRDRFVWIRMHIRVGFGLQGPVALHLSGLGFQPTAWHVFVNGYAVGGQGAFPPQADPIAPPISPVMPLPANLAAPGTTAVVADITVLTIAFSGAEVLHA